MRSFTSLSLVAMCLLLFVHAHGQANTSKGSEGILYGKMMNYSSAFLDMAQLDHSAAYLSVVGTSTARTSMHGRLWDGHRISNSFQSLNYGQLANLSKKVLAGESLTVVTYGDSVTAEFSGCYPMTNNHNSSWQGNSHPNFWFYKSHSEDKDPFEGRRCSRILPMAWMTAFLTLLNHTYPTKQGESHRYINFGTSSASLQGHAENDCLGDFLPPKIDLLIVEHFSMLENTEKVQLFAETHLHRLFLHNKGPMPVIYLNLFGFKYGNRATSPQEISVDKCLRSDNIATCSVECDPSNTFEGEPRVTDGVILSEMKVHEVARHYGLASWSHKAMLDGILRDRVHTAHDLTACDLFARLYVDSFHPRDGGRMLLADVLFYYISSGIELFKSNNSLWVHEGIHNIGLPLVPGSMLVPLIHCHFSKPMKTPGMTGDSLSGAMDVFKSDGWSHVDLDGPKKAFKPGWISETIGSKLWVKIPLLFHDGHSHITINYLSSYENMGQGRIGCVENCTCEAKVIDALSKTNSWSGGVGHSLDASLPLNLKYCIIEIEVVPTSDNRTRHKFKIISILSTSKVNMSSSIQALG